MYMDVPQQRERVFFIANNQGFNKLTLSFDRPLIPFGQVRTERGKPFKNPGGKYERLLQFVKTGDTCIADIAKRITGKGSGFNHTIVADDCVAPSNVSSACHFRLCDRLYKSDGDYINTQTFPQDYDFCGNNVQYVCGMSVPPNMMAHIATQVYEQWFKGGE